MLSLTLADRASPTILCLGAHADDIEIGAGGTILSLLKQYPTARIHWIVFSATPERADEARDSVRAFVGPSAQIVIHGVRDGFFPAEFTRLKELFETIKQTVRPDVIFTHHRGDSHQDHRLVAELTANTFRNHLILEYEIPKYDPDLGNPNLFVPLRQEEAQSKVAALMRHFSSQRGRQWFAPETFFGLMRLRGVQSVSPSGLAEGFYGPKLCLQFGMAETGARESRFSEEAFA
jgi:LmbE family N-acetylglucosaminyl deacetylase